MVKASSWESTIALFRDEYRVPVLSPELAAALATTFELGCSTMLILGLGTRLATLPLLGMIATIQLFVYPSAWPEHLVWGSILLFLLTRGPGAISLDHLIARAWPAAAAERAGRPSGAVAARRSRPPSALDHDDPEPERQGALVARVVRHEGREPADLPRAQHLAAGRGDEGQLALQHDAELRIEADVLARRGAGRKHEQRRRGPCRCRRATCSWTAPAGA